MQCMKDFILIAMKCENSCDRTKKCIKKAGRQVPCQVCQNVCPKRFLYTISTYGIKIFIQNRFFKFENKLNYKLKFLSISSFKALLHTKNTIMLLSIAAKKMTKFIIVLGR